MEQEINKIIELGDVEQNFEVYNFKIQRVLSNGNKTDYRAVIKDDKVRAILLAKYNVIPNEEVANIMDEVLVKRGFQQLSSNYSEDLNSFDAKYISPKIVEEPVKGDTINYGFSVHNRIDRQK